MKLRIISIVLTFTTVLLLFGCTAKWQKYIKENQQIFPETSGYVFVGKDYGITIDNKYYSYKEGVQKALKNSDYSIGQYDDVYDQTFVGDMVYFLYNEDAIYNKKDTVNIAFAGMNIYTGKTVLYKVVKNVSDSNGIYPRFDIILSVNNNIATLYYNGIVELYNLTTHTTITKETISHIAYYHNNILVTTDQETATVYVGDENGFTTYTYTNSTIVGMKIDDIYEDNILFYRLKPNEPDVFAYNYKTNNILSTSDALNLYHQSKNASSDSNTFTINNVDYSYSKVLDTNDISKYRGTYYYTIKRLSDNTERKIDVSFLYNNSDIYKKISNLWDDGTTYPYPVQLFTVNNKIIFVCQGKMKRLSNDPKTLLYVFAYDFNNNSLSYLGVHIDPSDTLKMVIDTNN